MTAAEEQKSIRSTLTIKSTIKEAPVKPMQIVPKCQIMEPYKLPKTFLYDLLLEKPNFHNLSIQEYYLRRKLIELEIAIKNK